MKKTTFKQKILLLFFGLFLSLVIIELGLRLGGVIYLSAQEARNKDFFQKNGYRILCLGDSLTAFGGDFSYPQQLEKALNQAVPSVGFKVINKGIPGADTYTVLSELKYNLDKYKPQMVVTMIGLNDESLYPYRNYRILRFKAFAKQFRIVKIAQLLLARLSKKDVLKDMYLERGRRLLELDHYPEAEAMFKKALELSSSDPLVYAGLGWYYAQRNMPSDAENNFRKALDLTRNNPLGYTELGRYYWTTERIQLAEEMFKKATEIRPNDPNLFCEFAQFYQDIQRINEAEAMFKKAIAICPEAAAGYSQLGWLYYEQGRYDLAEKAFQQAMGLDTNNLAVYKDLAFVKQAQNNQAESAVYFHKVRRFTDYFRQITGHNYRVLKDAILKRGIKLICVQYPMRSLSELKMIFDSPQGVIFVDNEMSFKQAVVKDKFEEYFKDRVGWDFGHCTAKGNYLLANNIADVIIKEFFNKHEMKR